MHLAKTFPLLSLVALASAAAITEVATEDSRAVAENAPSDAVGEDGNITKRACKSNGCKCRKGLSQGQYCAMCLTTSGFVVTNIGTNGGYDHKYECNPQGGCCDYGFSYDCDDGQIYCDGWGGK